MWLIQHLLFLTASPPTGCSVSEVQTFLPDLIGPARGSGPWLVDGANGRWAWAQNLPTKTLWILPTTRARVVIRGRELNSGTKTRFQVGGPDSAITDAMIVDDPWRASVIPGGATWEVKNRYLFLSSQVYYPSVGCYEFDITVGSEHRTITHELK